LTFFAKVKVTYSIHPIWGRGQDAHAKQFLILSCIARHKMATTAALHSSDIRLVAQDITYLFIVVIQKYQQ